MNGRYLIDMVPIKSFEFMIPNENKNISRRVEQV